MAETLRAAGLTCTRRPDGLRGRRVGPACRHRRRCGRRCRRSLTGRARLRDTVLLRAGLLAWCERALTLGAEHDTHRRELDYLHTLQAGEPTDVLIGRERPRSRGSRPGSTPAAAPWVPPLATTSPPQPG